MSTGGTTRVSPEPRQDTSLGFDDVRSRLVLFGGKVERDGEFVAVDDTWVYDVEKGRW